MRILKRIVWILSGFFLGTLLGVILAVCIVEVAKTQFRDRGEPMDPIRRLALLVIAIFAIAGALLGATSKRKRSKALLPLSPDLEEAARTHFNPSAPGGRIK